MILRIIIDVLIAVSLYFAIAGTIGINKMPDTFSRMQASTLITTLGVLGANIGAILYAIFIMHNGAAAVKIAVIAALVIAVNPIGAHAIAKGASAQELFQIPAREQIGRAKSVPAEEYAAVYDQIQSDMEQQIAAIAAKGGDDE